MPYYKDSKNNLHFLDDAEFVYLLPADCVPITDEEAAALQAPAAPTQEQIVATYEASVQVELDTFAESWQYESILSAASYANSTVPQYRKEATALIAWRDQVWLACYATLAAVISGSQPAPASTTAFIASLPVAPARPV